MSSLLRQLYLVSLACLVYGELDPYYKELLKIIAKNQILKSEEFEINGLDDEIKNGVKKRNEDIIEEERTKPGDEPKYIRKILKGEYKAIYNSTLKDSNFCPMPPAMQIGAEKRDLEAFPWIARVYHSPAKELPICTASALSAYVFTTAARCLATSKVGYTYVHYRNKVFESTAFVLPDTPTKQMFDDFGFIVVEPSADVRWVFLTPVTVPRTGIGYFWFDDLKLNAPTNKVVGFVENRDQDALYSLDDMYVSTELCYQIFRVNRSTGAYYVPCAHPCNVEAHEGNFPVCDRYMSGLGHAVLTKTGDLLGIVTWTCENDDYESQRRLPLGVAVANSDDFKLGLQCAREINTFRQTKEIVQYSQLCKDLRLPKIKT